MKIGKAKAPGIAGYKPPRKADDPERPDGYAGEGAPSKYRPEYCQSIVEYFDHPTSWALNTDAKGSAKAVPAGKLPTFERYAANLGVTSRTLLFWQEAHPEFKEAYEIAKSLQKAFILELSAAGVGNNNMALLLKVGHGMREPKEETPVDNLAEQLSTLIGKMPS